MIIIIILCIIYKLKLTHTQPQLFSTLYCFKCDEIKILFCLYARIINIIIVVYMQAFTKPL